MTPSAKDKIEGMIHELKGEVKVEAGDVTDNPKLQAEGYAEQAAGAAQRKFGQIEKVLEK